MDTEDLIAALAADDAPPARPRLLARVAAGLALSALALVLAWGIRPGWAEAVQAPPVLAKQLLPLAVLLPAAALLARAPGRALPLRGLALFGLAAAAAWVGAVLAGGDMLGRSAWQCLLSIPLLALPPGAALLLGLRHRVVTRPGRTGALAGLVAGAAAAALYAFHCDEDGAAFFLLWYGLGIAACGLAGRAAGRRVLGV